MLRQSEKPLFEEPTLFLLVRIAAFQKSIRLALWFTTKLKNIEEWIPSLMVFFGLLTLVAVMLNVSSAKVMKNSTAFARGTCNIIGAFYDVPWGLDHQHMSIQKIPFLSYVVRLLWPEVFAPLPLPFLRSLIGHVCSNPPRALTGSCFFAPLWPTWYPSGLILWRWMLPIAYWPNAYSSSLTWQVSGAKGEVIVLEWS